jgi:hypothetical protein
MSKITSGIVLFSLLMALSLGVAFAESEVAVTENETMNESMNESVNATMNATMNETMENETMENETMDEAVEEPEAA